MNKESLIEMCQEHNLVIDKNCIEKFDTFYDFLVQENAKYNLTAITSYEDVLEKHFYDSLSILFTEKLEGKTIDIGCGGGFPGIPLKLAKPDIDLTCLDATAKKINYINELADKLNINVSGVVARAEEYKEKYDNVVIRGVAALNILLEIICDIIKPNGCFIAMKGSKYKEELEQSKNAITKLGYKLERIEEYTLPSDNSLHANLIFKKIKQHDKTYPRNYSQIKKRPL